MEIINFTQEYEMDVIHLWNRCCSFDEIDLTKFRRQALLDDNFDSNLCWIALDEKKVVGFIMATKRKFPYLERGLEPQRGWINVFFVDPDVEREGIGTQLYIKAEQALQCLGATNITMGAYSPNYFFPGIDENHYPKAASFLKKMGYDSSNVHYSMEKQLMDYEMPEAIVLKKHLFEEKGYQFIPFEGFYSLELLSFLRDEFGGGWKRNALLAMQNQTAEEVILLVLNPQGKICGFSMRAIDGNPMRFGPIGIAADERNSGIGSVLLQWSCHEMAKRGIKRMFFMTTDEAGKRFYLRNGLSVIRTYVDYKKEL